MPPTFFPIRHGATLQSFNANKAKKKQKNGKILILSFSVQLVSIKSYYGEIIFVAQTVLKNFQNSAFFAKNQPKKGQLCFTVGNTFPIWNYIHQSTSVPIFTLWSGYARLLHQSSPLKAQRGGQSWNAFCRFGGWLSGSWSVH